MKHFMDGLLIALISYYLASLMLFGKVDINNIKFMVLMAVIAGMLKKVANEIEKSVGK